MSPKKSQGNIRFLNYHLCMYNYCEPIQKLFLLSLPRNFSLSVRFTQIEQHRTGMNLVYKKITHNYQLNAIHLRKAC